MVEVTSTDDVQMARRAYDNGFEDGSIAACNAILGFMQRRGIAGGDIVLAAWNAGALIEAPQTVVVADPAPPTLIRGEIGAPKLGRKEAIQSGYTGDTCTVCESIRVKRNGSCLVCEECGQTTGCS